MSPAQITSEAGDTEKHAVYAWLREFNHEQNGVHMKSLTRGAQKVFFFIARDSTGETVGGLDGSILHRWLRIDLMAVSPACRKFGIGSDLVHAAEKRGVENGCEQAYVDTMSYQAPNFYEQLGYHKAGRLHDWDSHGHDKNFLVKDLTI